MFFGNFCHQFHQYHHHHYHNYHLNHRHLYFFLSYAQYEKRGPSCPNWGERGGGLIWAMPESKHSFFCEVFPKAKGTSPITNDDFDDKKKMTKKHTNIMTIE